MRAIPLIIVKLLCCILLTATLAKAQSQHGAILKGKVTNEDGVLEGATVVIDGQTKQTDQDGQFHFALAPGNHQLTVSYSGHHSIQKKIVLQPGETLRLNLELEPDTQVGQTVILGAVSHAQRLALKSPVPIQYVNASHLLKGQPDITQQLANNIPSFNSPPQAVGTNATVTPGTLRGLGPDETLVLLNGHRLHTSSTVFLQYSLAYGTSFTDLNWIPVAGLSRIEVLSDGAGAQYGADAIAGVINLVPRSTIGKTAINIHQGQTYTGDGSTIVFDLNRGFRLGKKGVVSFTSTFRHSEHTQRNGAYDSTVYYSIPANATTRTRDSLRALDNAMVSARGFDRLNHRRIGNPLLYNTGLMINGELPVGQKTSLYFTTVYNYRRNEDIGSSVYRYPKDSNTTGNIALFPNGYQPKVVGKMQDYTAVAGIKSLTKGWNWNLDYTSGASSFRTDISNTINASQVSMGKLAQTKFYTGTTLLSQNTMALQARRDLGALLKPFRSIDVNLGIEYRLEHYQIREGEEASWKNYAPNTGRIGGSQGVPGFAPENAIRVTRYFASAFAGAELICKNNLLVDMAARFDQCNDFGGYFSGKLAGRYEINKQVSIRASVSNGIRAPAIQQRYFSAVNQVTRFNQYFVTGTYRNNSPVAAAFGIQPLKAERSVDLGAGFVINCAPRFNITVDYYWIRIADRITLTGLIQRNIATPQVGHILDSVGRYDIAAVRFFTNPFSTNTRGLDIVMTRNLDLRHGKLELSLAANFNSTHIYHLRQPATNLPTDSVYLYSIINPEEQGRMEQAQPRDKIILRGTYNLKRWQWGLYMIHYGKAAHIFQGADRKRDEYFSPKIICGAAVTYSFQSWFSLQVGARNIFNHFPDKLKNHDNSQAGLAVYDFNGTQIGFNGGYYFVNVAMNF